MTYSSIKLIAFALTIFIHFTSLVMFYFYEPLKEDSDRGEEYIEITLEEEVIEEKETLEPEEEEEKIAEEVQSQKDIKTSVASNQSAESKNSEPAKSNNSTQTTEENQEESSAESQDNNMNDIAGSNDNVDLKDNGDVAVNNEKENTDKFSSNSSNSNAYTGESYVSFKLENRFKKNLPPPTYMCPKGGTVVVDISVNKKGKVVKAKVNEQLTEITDECLHTAAINFAEKSTFNMDFDASFRQDGTITYVFQQQEKR